MLDSTNPRDALRAAIASRDAAAEQERAAAKAVVAARRMLDEAEHSLSMLAGVDDEITAHQANEIKTWATSGGERPSGALPSHLATKREFKAEIAAKVIAARSALEMLSKEQVGAATRAAIAEGNVQCAAGAVLSAEAGPLIEDLLRTRRTLWALEDKLRSLSAVRYFDADGRSVLIKMPPDTFAALNETAPPMLAGSVPKPYAIALAGWQRYLQELTENSEASLD